jgi:hypothetical protein
VLDPVGQYGRHQEQPGKIDAAERALDAPTQFPAPQAVEHDMHPAEVQKTGVSSRQ